MIRLKANLMLHEASGAEAAMLTFLSEFIFYNLKNVFVFQKASLPTKIVDPSKVLTLVCH